MEEVRSRSSEEVARDVTGEAGIGLGLEEARWRARVGHCRSSREGRCCMHSVEEHWRRALERVVHRWMPTVVVDAREAASGFDRGLQTPACSLSSARPGDVWFSLAGIHVTTSWRNVEIYLLWLSVPMPSHKVSDQKLFQNVVPGAMNLRWQRVGVITLVVGHGRLALTQ